MATRAGRLARALPDYSRTAFWAVSRHFVSSGAPLAIVQGVILSEAGVLLVVRVEPDVEAPGVDEYRLAIYFLNLGHRQADLIEDFLAEAH